MQINGEVKGDDVFKICDKIKINGLVIDNDLNLIDAFPDLKSFSNYDPDNLHETDFYINKSKQQNQALVENVYHQIDSIDQLKELEKTGYHGLALTGGPEEKTGLKDFGEIDDIIEYLEE